ncbi:hypothetical protein OIV83_001390 [Microbotryomycetes sp. JL201]|nr:hypothetical protein OIV83_001390 [Microbotryomycetes sp. JL201]
MYDDPIHSSASSTAKSPHISRAGELLHATPTAKIAMLINSPHTAPVMKIVNLPSSKDHLEAFNDLALQWLDPALEPTLDDPFWRDADYGTQERQGDPCAVSTSNQKTTVKDEKDKVERALIDALSRTSL